ncbi:MAG: hypothetical protein ACJA0Z_004750 [Halioglobus sp.]|jgi:hypothetical protein
MLETNLTSYLNIVVSNPNNNGNKEMPGYSTSTTDRTTNFQW